MDSFKPLAGILVALLRNRGAIEAACGYVTRRFRAMYRHACAQTAHGKARAMHVAGIDQTWMCVMSACGSGVRCRFAIAPGCAIDRIGAALDDAEALLFDRVLVVAGLRAGAGDRTNHRLISSLPLPDEVMIMALHVDKADVSFRHWSGGAGGAVDAMYIEDVDHTWCCVTDAAGASLVVLHGYALDGLEDVCRGRGARPLVTVNECGRGLRVE